MNPEKNRETARPGERRRLAALLADVPDAAEIKKGGGTRRFFRLNFRKIGVPAGTAPAVVCVYDSDREENRYYAEIARFLKKIGVPVPEIFLDVPEENFLVMEDCGATDLWTLAARAEAERRTQPRASDSAEKLCAQAYRSALAALAVLHSRGIVALDAAAAAGTPLAMMRDGFNRDYYRWERDYFLKNALDEGLKIALTPSERAALERELAALAETLLALPRQLVHRDCQSQNILWAKNSAQFIDFQGMRVGTGWYDVASLIFDPYVKFSPAFRASLFRFYCEEIGVPTDAAASENLRRAAAQRLMQALGAYFFLSQKMGKPHFRAHALPALENLVRVASGPLPRLHALAQKMLEAERKIASASAGASA